MRGKQDNRDESVYNFFKRRMNKEVCMLSDFASLCFHRIHMVHVIVHLIDKTLIKRVGSQDRSVEPFNSGHAH